ncbi:MAG: TonB-dependent receptor [Acidobacteriota bacterium]
MPDRSSALLMFSLFLASGLPAVADDQAADKDATKGEVKEKVDVKERADDMVGVADSATEGATGQKDLAKRPLLRPGEVLETVPGVIITQHSGSGKANQYFMRGFNLDHGTDIRITVGDIQVNMPSHGHGQGYADLNFLIPELIDTVRFKKGPYYADEGDFSAAGAVSIDYVRSLDKGIIDVSGGSFGYGRALVADSLHALGGELLAALEAKTFDGPWEQPEDLRHWNGLVRFSRGDDSRGLSITAMGYSGKWISTDQIPERGIREGLFDRFGLVDPSDGGESSRYSLAAELHRYGSSSFTKGTLYLLSYDLTLFSNFTYFLDDPINGDQFEQDDERMAYGVALNHTWLSEWGGRHVETTIGLQARNDVIDNGLFHTAERERIGTTREDHINQLMVGPFVEASISWTDKIRTRTGLRLDSYRAGVDSNLPENSGDRSDFLASPKVSLILGPWAQTEVYVNAGYGFHSNDARGATIRVDPKTGEVVQTVDPLVRAKGADIGLRTSAVPGLRSSVSFYGLDLDSEIIFVGDAGATEAGRPSRRLGGEPRTTTRLRPLAQLRPDVAHFEGAVPRRGDPAGDRIPGAIEGVVAAGVSVDDLHNYFGSVRLRYFGPRPLIEDDSVRSGATTLVNAQVGYRFHNGLSLGVEALNLLDADADDITYY